MRNIFLIFITLLLPILAFSQSKQKFPKRFKLPSELKEVSGLFIKNANEFWWHNDSGNSPILYQTNAKGKLTKKIHLDQIKNIDWEELTHDDKGNIYIGDFGNNRNKRKDLKIYIYNFETENLDSINFSYPDQTQFPPPSSECNFDMEAFFYYKNQLHLFSKNRLNVGNGFTKYYTLEAKGGEQLAVLKDSINLKNRVVTAAAISPDKKTVALLSYTFKKRKPIPKSKASIFIFRDFEGTDFLKGKMKKKKVPVFLVATQYEALDFLDNRYIFIASEKTKFIKQKGKRLEIK